MQLFFIAVTVAITLVNIPLIVMLLKKNSNLYDRFAAISGIGVSVVLFLVMIGFADNRVDLYLDIAFSYAALSFVSSIIVAKFMNKRGTRK